ncbi:hypothetical protein AAF712_016677 [Marasmius tenuissimus]|uniref:AB hydrolase-1 domain-containing protein n=1 Tax=Marasmius tenuissimus TaxID=585030 RepID=A0ABR2Z587_9AGAR
MRLSIPSLATVCVALVTLPLGPAVSAAAAPSLSKHDFLDPSNYKNTTTSRGIAYNYYFSPPANDDRRFLVFLHGWPGLSYDYRFQVDFFKKAGYGVIIPDMLGYGNTDKPTDPEVYKSSLISRDIVDILDAESVDNNVVVVGHDWGSKITARIANYFPDRFSAFGFLAVGNLGPAFFDTPYSVLNNLTKAVMGYESFGYWDFFSRPGAHEILEDRLESLFSLAHTANAVETIVNWAPLGALEAWVTSDRRSASTVWTPEEEAHYLKAYGVPDAVEASLAWYKVLVSGIEAQDNKNISPENLNVKKPVFFGAALQDFVATAPSQVKATLDSSANSTVHLYNSGHWVHWETKDEVNRDLLAWIEGLE